MHSLVVILQLVTVAIACGNELQKPEAELEWERTTGKYEVCERWRISLPDERWVGGQRGTTKVPAVEADGGNLMLDDSAVTQDFDNDDEVDFAIVRGPGVEPVDSEASKGEDAKKQKRKPQTEVMRALRLYRGQAGPCWTASGYIVAEIADTPIRIIDQDNDGRFNGFGRDALVIGTDDRAAFLTSVVRIGDSLFEFEVSRDGKEIQWRAFADATGELRWDGALAKKLPKSAIVVLDDKRKFSFLLQPNETIVVPEGEYRIAGGWVGSSRDSTIRAGRMEPVAVTKGKTSRIVIGPADGEAFVAGVEPLFGSESTNDVEAGDLDGDGDADLVLANSADVQLLQGFPMLTDIGHNGIYRNDGRGRMRRMEESVIARDRRETTDVELVDLDGDGDLDIVAANAFAFQLDKAKNQLFMNDGKGKFDEVKSGPIVRPNEGSNAIAAGDVNGDGRIDLLFGNGDFESTSGAPFDERGIRNRLYLNRGKGRFKEASIRQFPSGVQPTKCIELADLDGDGHLDIVELNGTTWAVGPVGPHRIYWNDGKGNFTKFDEKALEPCKGGPLALAIGDFDGDDDPDLFCGTAHGLFVFENLGERKFKGSSLGYRWPPNSGFAATRALELADIDGDGRLDLVASRYHRREGRYQHRTFVYLQKSKGTIELDTLDTSALNSGRRESLALGIPTCGDPASAFSVVDLDGDGSKELVGARATWHVPGIRFGETGGHNTVHCYSDDGGDAKWREVTLEHLPFEARIVILRDCDLRLSGSSGEEYRGWDWKKNGKPVLALRDSRTGKPLRDDQRFCEAPMISVVVPPGTTAPPQIRVVGSNSLFGKYEGAWTVSSWYATPSTSTEERETSSVERTEMQSEER